MSESGFDELFSKVKSAVLKANKVDDARYNEILEYVTGIMGKIKTRVSRYLEKPDEDIFLGGSFPRKTFLKDEFDIDIFIRFPPGLSREELRDIIFSTAIELFGADNVRERFADHPYAEATVNGITVNMVPSYKTEPPNWLSPVDRSYFHTIYLSRNLNRDLVDDVLLFKAFLKGVRCYGAEISVKGFSGYLTELLIIHYKGFRKALEAIRKWRPPVIIDLEGHYNSDKELLDMFPGSHLIVVDPVDKGRNVASALNLRNFSRLISATKAFLKSPRKEFFYPFSKDIIKSYLSKVSRKDLANIPILAIITIHGDKIEDIYHGQLEKLARKIRRQIELSGIDVLKLSIYSDYEEKSIILFLLSSKSIPTLYIKTGPPVYLRSEEDYLIKNRGNPYVWIRDDGRWASIKGREYSDVKELVIEILNNNVIKIPSEVVNDEIHIVYIDELDNEFLNEFWPWIASFIKGEDYWRIFY